MTSEPRTAAGLAQPRPRAGAGPDPGHSRLIAYYEQAGPDFAQWSAGFNMHFGYYRRGLNPLDRESMLNELKQRIREVRQGPDGLLYLLTDEDDGALLRIEPAS